MRVHKLTSGTEAGFILGELGRLLDGRPDLVVERVDEWTLAIDGGDGTELEHLLVAISPTWPIHVRVE